MLKILELSFIGALICTIITGGATAIIRKNLDDIKECPQFYLISFIVEFLWMSVFLYSSCKPFTLTTVLIWMWPALLVNILLYIFWNIEGVDTINNVSHIILMVISFIGFLSSIFGNAQKLVYVHDISNTDISYTVSSNVILANFEPINNSDYKYDYDVDSPEIRQVNEEDIAVYHISDSSSTSLNAIESEYIPGYVVKKKGELPKIMHKKMYFDTSYTYKKDALRTVRRKYQTVVIGSHKFDIDDDYNPYEIFEYRKNLFSTNGKDYGLILLNLMDGTSEKYPVEQIPDWVDFTTTYPR